ncbi:MAG: glycosyltransferase family 4 protein [Caldilineaceae bacterium]|nr:glycosyltransferase family 4 protein [Caldilineaceae bacterium]HRJ43388.1 glycosyltransferase family 4 protein [Caldilineaceae bacterium]
MSALNLRRRPRILFVAPFGLRQKTTVWARILPLARYLAAQDCFVTLLIPPWDSPEDGGKRWGDNGVEVVNVSLLGGLPSITRRLLAEIDSQRPDIVHIIKPRAYAGIVQWILWQRRRWVTSAGPRLVLDVDDWERAWSSVGGYHLLMARFLEWQERWGFAHADAITAASGWLVHKAGELAPGTPSLYLPNGVTPPARQPYRSPFDVNRPPTVLWFTRFIEVEPAWMGAWWRALRSHRPEIHLLVAGAPLQKGRNGPFRMALGRNDDAITWLGYVPQPQLAEVYARSDCAIFPAAEIPLNQAKCSVRLATTLLEGVPVVASAVGEQARYGADGAAKLVAPDASPEAFALAVVNLLEKRKEQELQVGQARRWLLSRYDWSRLGEELLAFYGEMLKKG